MLVSGISKVIVLYLTIYVLLVLYGRTLLFISFIYNSLYLLILFWPSVCILCGEGNGNPLQYSFLENPRDGGAWWAAVYGVYTDSDTTEVT